MTQDDWSQGLRKRWPGSPSSARAASTSVRRGSIGSTIRARRGNSLSTCPNPPCRLSTKAASSEFSQFSPTTMAKKIRTQVNPSYISISDMPQKWVTNQKMKSWELAHLQHWVPSTFIYILLSVFSLCCKVNHVDTTHSAKGWNWALERHRIKPHLWLWLTLDIFQQLSDPCCRNLALFGPFHPPLRVLQ